jgi:ribosomal protein S18 acetylase RimI-like enzyme
VGYEARHFEGVDRLWLACFPDDPPCNGAANAIPAKLALADGLLFVAEDDAGEDDAGQVIGSVMAGYDGHRGWLYSVAVTPERRSEGLGTALVEHACAALAARGCVKLNLQVRAGNEAVARFYEKLGFAREPRISMGRELTPSS